MVYNLAAEHLDHLVSIKTAMRLEILPLLSTLIDAHVLDGERPKHIKRFSCFSRNFFNPIDSSLHPVDYVGCAAAARYLLGWDVMPSWLAGVAMSTTSVAVVYAVMLEFGFNATSYGKVLLAACFITDLGTVVALGLIFANAGRSQRRPRGCISPSGSSRSLPRAASSAPR